MDDYLEHLDLDPLTVSIDLAGLTMLQRAHLTAVPFENLDVFAGRVPPVDPASSIRKIVTDGRGGWCFELNGAFGSLLESLGFDVLYLGAAVLLDGPTQLVDHLCLEVMLDQPYLVDVGFGDSFTVPLRLNTRDPQDGGAGIFEFIDSSQGLTLTRHDDTGIPEPQYRFRRVNHPVADFAPAAERLATDPNLQWSTKPFATRLIGGGPDRVTLLRDRVRHRVDGEWSETPVAAEAWGAELERWFGMAVDLSM